MMRTGLRILIGAIAGILSGFLLTLLALWLFPVITDLGGDAASQGLMGSLLAFVLMPVCAVIGGVRSHQKCVN